MKWINSNISTMNAPFYPDVNMFQKATVDRCKLSRPYEQCWVYLISHNYGCTFLNFSSILIQLALVKRVKEVTAEGIRVHLLFHVPRLLTFSHRPRSERFTRLALLSPSRRRNRGSRGRGRVGHVRRVSVSCWPTSIVKQLTVTFPIKSIQLPITSVTENSF